MKRTALSALKMIAAKVGLAAALAALAAGCQPAPKATQSVPTEASAPVIERAALFGNPERTQARISPTGEYISFLAPRDGYLNVYVMKVGEDVAAARPLTADSSRGVRQYFWAQNGAQILYLQDKEGDENWRLHAVDVASGEAKDLTPLDKVQAQIVGMSRREPDYVLVGLNDRDPKWHDVYKINTRTGKRALIQRNTENFSSFVADEDNILRLAAKDTASGAVELYAFHNQGRWTKMFDVPFEDSLTTYPLGFEASGASFLMLDSVGRDKAALVRVEAGSGVRTVLGESQKADVTDVWIDPVSKAPQAFAAEYLKLDWVPLTEAAKADLEFLKANLKGDAQVISRADDDSKWIVAEEGPQTPITYYLYDRKAKSLQKLFAQRPALANAPLMKMIPVELPAGDGLTLVSYLTLPPGSDLDDNGRPEKPVPLVLNVHGGPWARDAYGLDPEHQWLANRGYAVLSVNFRGSTGFGKAFVNASNREWGGKMQQDLIDAVDWAVREQIAKPEAVAIYGGSYGGYAALAGLSFTPEKFACGVSIVGPSSLETLIGSFPPYWESFRNQYYLRVGDPRTAEGRKFLADRSPLNKAGDITKPLLIAQGANDPRVNKAESDQIVKAMKAKGLPVTYVVYADEGHGFGRPQNRMSFYAVAEAFLSQCLGGRYEPIGKDFVGASLSVAEGADLTPGVAEALAALAPPAAPAAAPAAALAKP